MNSPSGVSRFARGEAAASRVSFEFFPPKTEEMEKSAVGGDRAAGAAGAELRLGDLWRRRLDARAHPRDRRAHPRRDAR